MIIETPETAAKKTATAETLIYSNSYPKRGNKIGSTAAKAIRIKNTR